MSHEKTITLGFNMGGVTRYFNLPSVHQGKALSREQIVERFRRSKSKGQGFGSIKEAVDSAGKRSRSFDKGRLVPRKTLRVK